MSIARNITAPVISLMFHDVTDWPLTSGFRQPTAQRYKHNVRQFQGYLDVVRDSGFKLVNAESLPSVSRNGVRVIFTFDDGGEGAMTAADQLESFGWRGLFFITTDLIGTAGFLSVSQILELADRGHVIGSHSCSHPDVFRSLARTEMLREWSDSRDCLEQQLSKAVTCASVPGGDLDRESLQTASEVGFTDVFTSEQTTKRWQIGESTCYGRMIMVDTTSPARLQRWLRFPRAGILPEKAVRAAKSRTKKILGPIYQRMIQRRRSQHVANDQPHETRPQASPAHSTGSRVVALINPNLHCRSTCAELIEAGVNLVGIVECQTRTAGLPVKNFRRMARRQGLGPTMSQVAARLLHLATRHKQDQEIYRQLFDRTHVERILDDWGGELVACESYGDAQTLTAIRALQPDILVVHSQSWVDQQVRKLPSTGLVIGGHPGVTPHYRGSHSSFWALLNEDRNHIGWTAFHVDKGVDTGDVILQGRLEVQPDDSYMTLNWQGMKHIAKAQAAAILEYDRTGQIARQPHSDVPDGSEFGLPGLSEYRRYQRIQSGQRRVA